MRVTGTNDHSNFKMDLVNLREGFYDALYYERGSGVPGPGGHS